MENMKAAAIPVTLKGVNYLLWSRMVKTALGGRGLWNHITENEAPKQIAKDDAGKEIILVDESKWIQEDMMVLSIIQSSLDIPILEAYSYCESAKALWETLQKVYGNTSNLNRIFEVKKSLNSLTQGGLEFTQHLGKYRALWAELEMLRPSSVDPTILNERSEQDNVFGLFFTLDSTYNDLIKHILRADKLPSFEDVCAQIQKEQGSLGLFGGKGDLTLANKAEVIQVNNAEPVHANKVFYKQEERRGPMCDHCKKRGHTKGGCWLLHPHLRPTTWREPRPNTSRPFERTQGTTAFFANRMRAQEKAGTSNEGGATAMTASSQMVQKSDIEALIQALKDSGISGHTFSALTTSPKSLIVDSGASHHMISNSKLIKDIEPVIGNVVVANGEQVPIKGIGNLRLFDKNSKAFYMPSFTSNLLSVKKATNDLNCRVIFTPNEVQFQDIESDEIFGKGVTKDDLYVLEDMNRNAPLSCFSSNLNSSMCNSKDDGSLWHARLGHPHFSEKICGSI